MSEYKQKEFLKEYAVFFAIDEKQAAKIDFNKLYQASRGEKGIQQPHNIPSEIKNHPDFGHNQKVFFGVPGADETES